MHHFVEVENAGPTMVKNTNGQLLNCRAGKLSFALLLKTYSTHLVFLGLKLAISRIAWQPNSLRLIHAHPRILLNLCGGEFLTIWAKIIHNSVSYATLRVSENPRNIADIRLFFL